MNDAETKLECTADAVDSISFGLSDAKSEREWYQSIFNRIPVAVVIIDASDGKYIFANELSKKFLGGYNILEADSSKERPYKVYDTNGRLLRLDEYPTSRAVRGETIINEVIQLKTDHSSYFVNVNTDRVPALFGYPEVLIVPFQDVTALVEQETLRRQSEELLQITLKSIGDAVISMTADPIPKVQFLNPIAERLTGWKARDAVGKPVSEIFKVINSLTRKPTPNPIFEVIKTGLTLSHEQPAQLLSKSGEAYSIKDNANPIIDERGNVRGVVLIFRDISEEVRLEIERAKVEQLAQQEQQKIFGLFSQAPVPICLLEGRDHRFILANKKYIDLLVGGRNVLGMTVKEALPEVEGQGFYELLDQVFETGKVYHGTEQKILLTQSDGKLKEYYLNFIYQPLFDSDKKVYGISVIATDVTQVVLSRNDQESSSIRFKTLANAMPQIVWTADSKGQLDYVNERWTEFSGSSDPALWFDFVHDDDKERTARAWLLSVNSGALYEAEFRIRRLDGEYFWHLVRAVPSLNSLGLVDAWFGTCTDISKQISLQEEANFAAASLLRSEEQLAQAIKTSKIGFWNVELPSEKISFSPQMVEDWGIDLAIFSGKLSDAVACIHPEDREGVLLEIEKAIVDQQPYNAEYRVVKPNDEIIWIEARGELLFDQNGVAHRFTGTSSNITEEVRIREELAASANSFIRLADSMPQIVWTANGSGYVDYYNKQWFDYTGLSFEQTEGWRWDAVVHPDELQKCIETWTKSFTTGSHYSMEYRLKRYDGSYRWHLGRAVPVTDRFGKRIKWYGTNTDIHEYKTVLDELEVAKAAAEKANNTKSAFLANMSHEIRTPLGAIIGFSELLKDSNVTPADQMRYIETIHRSGSSLTRIIDDILDLAKVEAGKLEVEHVDFFLGELIDEVASLFAETAKLKGISFTIEIDDTVPKRISSDPTRIRQILINILGNAIKFTQKGGVHLKVNARFLEWTNLLGSRIRDKANPRLTLQLVFAVEDTGPGLSMDERERLFVPFTQADDTTTRRYGGTGLGLALSRRLSEALGGTITIAASSLGRGSTFVITLKVQSAFEINDSLPVVEVDKDNIEINLTGIRVLVVDDSEDNQDLIEEILRRSGAHVSLANNGREAVEMVSSVFYDIILMDIQMPEMDGYQALEKIQSFTRTIPVIALTAHAMREERIKTLAAGFVAHLTKPLNFELLLQTVVLHANVKEKS